MILNQSLAELVSIGITTKNRWEDLETSLIQITKQDLKDLPIIIVDDGSDTLCPFDLAKFSLKIQFKRFTDSKGLIVRRNQLAQTIQTKYYLSLDDDSFPVAGSLLKAVQFAESCPNLLCLSFPIYNPILTKYQSQSLQKIPYQVKFFIGCGHLLHRQHFLQLGGYREELIHQGEEMEIAAKAFQQGLFCYHFPGFEIHHVASNAARNWHRMDFYGSRNNVLWNDWYVPNELNIYQQLRTFLSKIILSFKVGRITPVKGQMAGIRDIYTYQKYRDKMTLNSFRKWKILPDC